MSKRRKYSAEFKREAVQLAAMPDVTLRQVVKDLGINEGLLGRWKRDLETSGEKAFVGQGHARDHELHRPQYREPARHPTLTNCRSSQTLQA